MCLNHPELVHKHPALLYGGRKGPSHPSLTHALPYFHRHFRASIGASALPYNLLRMRKACIVIRRKDGERVSLQFSLFLSAMGPLFTLLLTAALSTSLPSLSSVFFHPIFQPVMNRLSLFNGVHPGLSRLEFTELLRVYPTDSLKSLRADLFVEVCNLGLVPNELLGIPLVDRRDSALRPISNVLSNDVWKIAQSISNNVPIPRTILKNGKRSHKFLQSQISNQHSATTQSTEEAEEAASVEPTTTHSSPTASSSELQTSPNASSSRPQTSLTSFAFHPPPRMPATSLQSRENSDCSTLPSRCY